MYEVLGNLRNLVELFLVTVGLCAAESLILLRKNPVSEKKGGVKEGFGAWAWGCAVQWLELGPSGPVPAGTPGSR